MDRFDQIDPAFGYDGTQNGFDIGVRNHPLTDVPNLLLSTGGFKKGNLEFLYSPPSPEAEEVGISQQRIKDASLVFERTRNKVIAALQAMVAHVFQKFDIPNSNGLDIGSGATGAMIGQMLTPVIDRSTWTHSDVNPGAVESIKKRYPDDRAVVGSYLNMGEMRNRDFGGEELDVVTGLSSLDATQFIEKAVAEIRDALKEGGYLFHVQDVRPGLGIIYREMTKMGYKQPYGFYGVEQGQDLVPLVVETYGRGTMWDGHLGAYSVQELFRQNLSDAIANVPGMKLLFNHWVTAKRDIRDGASSKLYYANMMVEHPMLHIILGRRNPFEEASAVVTVARKTA